MSAKIRLEAGRQDRGHRKATFDWSETVSLVKMDRKRFPPKHREQDAHDGEASKLVNRIG